MNGESKLIPSTSKLEIFNENESPLCNTNNKLFRSKKAFSKHCKQSQSEGKFVCDNCNKAFSSKFTFEKHSKKQSCKLIDKKSPCEISVKNKLLHIQQHIGEKKFECDVCKKRFSYKSSYQKHIREHKSNGKLICHVCQKGFLRKVYLKQHLRTHTGEKPYVCEVCFKSFATSSQFSVHSRIHTGRKPYICDICYKRFRHIDTFNYHNLFVHNEPESSHLHKCSVCGNSFRKRSSLLRHELTHKKATEPNLSEIDNSLLNSTQDNLQHSSNDEQLSYQDNLKAQDTHSELKPYVCHICQLIFSDEKSLQTHSGTHITAVISVKKSPPNSIYDGPMHSSDDEQFMSQDNLKAADTISRIITSSDNLPQDYPSHVEEKFICDVCDEPFSNKDELISHFKIHTEQKYYVCEVCQLCFLDEEDLRNHENIEECFNFHTCKICGEKFVDKIKLETHSRTHVGFASEISFSSSFHKLSNIDQHCAPSQANVKRNVSEESTNFDDGHSENISTHVEDTPYNCELCDKTFSNENDLKQHKVLHDVKKTHVCGRCLKNFDGRPELETHVCKFAKKNKMETLKDKVYTCDVCLKNFTYYYEFQIHVFEHSQKIECKICGKRFFNESGLKAHCLQSHKPPMHPCIVCKAKFANKSDLIAHCLSHVGSGEYFMCGSCKKCFKTREDLQNHSPCCLKIQVT